MLSAQDPHNALKFKLSEERHRCLRTACRSTASTTPKPDGAQSQMELKARWSSTPKPDPLRLARVAAEPVARRRGEILQLQVFNLHASASASDSRIDYVAKLPAHHVVHVVVSAYYSAGKHWADRTDGRLVQVEPDVQGGDGGHGLLPRQP